MSDNANPASGCTGQSSCSLPEDLRVLRYHLKSAIADLDKYEGYNEAGRRYIVESVDRVISDAFKRLNHFKANKEISGKEHETVENLEWVSHKEARQRS